jgi:hypothetical protein
MGRFGDTKPREQIVVRLRLGHSSHILPGNIVQQLIVLSKHIVVIIVIIFIILIATKLSTF